MENLNVTIIIVTYNGTPWLDACLQSCVGWPIIIVDNASTDETVCFIEANYPDITLLKQKKNLGFGQANNLGMRYALNQGADHVFLLNQDAYLVNSVLDDLISFQKEQPEYGILSPIHIIGNQKKLDKNFSNYMLREVTGQFYSDFVLSNPVAPVYQVPFVNAAAWLISRKCIECVGGFDPLFFHYGEDDNYCQRASYHGFKIGVLPKAYIIHDREERPRIKITVFSPEYYKNKERTYKILFANINLENELDIKAIELQNTIFKLKLKMKFNRAASFKKQLFILLKIKNLVIKSRDVNKTRGMHYL
jgi:GT2 family glycosyltransferase